MPGTLAAQVTYDEGVARVFVQTDAEFLRKEILNAIQDAGFTGAFKK